MNKRYRLVIFDWEGTLSDTLGVIIHCVSEEAQRMNLGPLDAYLARQYVDLGLVNAIKKLYPHLSLQQYEKLLDAVQHALVAKHAEIYLFAGAKELVQLLHEEGVLLAIATNKGQSGLQKALLTTGLQPFFNTVRCAGQLPPKPHPAMLKEILAALDVDAKEAVMIGDSVSDMEMANQAGVDALGVDFYNRETNNLKVAGAFDVFTDYESLAHFLKDIIL